MMITYLTFQTKYQLLKNKTYQQYLEKINRQIQNKKLFRQLKKKISKFKKMKKFGNKMI